MLIRSVSSILVVNDALPVFVSPGEFFLWRKSGLSTRFEAALGDFVVYCLAWGPCQIPILIFLERFIGDKLTL